MARRSVTAELSLASVEFSAHLAFGLFFSPPRFLFGPAGRPIRGNN